MDGSNTNRGDMRYYITKDGTDVLVNPEQITVVTMAQEPNGSLWIANVWTTGAPVPVVLIQPNFPALRAYVMEGEHF